VGDNIDNNAHAFYQRMFHITKSLHYFQSYAVFDTIDFSVLSDKPPEFLVKVKFDEAGDEMNRECLSLCF